MNSHRLPSLLLSMFVATGALAAAPYAGQQTRDVKALSAEEVSALLGGKGMGFAKAAELNGFAGPAHVLELATELQLTDEQRVRTEALFAAMSASAIAAGRMLVDCGRTSLKSRSSRQSKMPDMVSFEATRQHPNNPSTGIGIEVAQTRIGLPHRIRGAL